MSASETLQNPVFVGAVGIALDVSIFVLAETSSGIVALHDCIYLSICLSGVSTS